MTDELTYTHALGDTLGFSGKPAYGWDNERIVNRQEGRMGISNDPNKGLRKVTITTYIDSAEVDKIHKYMMPSVAKDYAALSAVDGAVLDDGGVETDDTTDANDAGAGDVPLLPANPLQEDAFYFGMGTQVAGICINVSQAGAGVWTITWEYSTGSDGWTALSGVTDETDGFTAAASAAQHVTWTVPPDWKTDSVGGIDDIFWVRARVSAFTSETTPPIATQMWLMGRYPHLTAVIDGNITWDFPCQMQKPSTGKSSSSKYTITVTFQERTF